MMSRKGAFAAVGVVRVFLKRVLCLFDKHDPKRSTTHWDGVNYVGECRHCGQKIRRRSRHNWKTDWMEAS